MFTKVSFFKKKLRGLSLKIFYSIENNGNSNLNENGERVFVNNILKYFIDKKCTDKIVVFDVGANAGDYARLITDVAKKCDSNVSLHLFEPQRKCFIKLSSIFGNGAAKLNGFGVSDEEQETLIYYDKEESTLASLHNRNLKYYDLDLALSEKVQLRRLDSYIEENNIGHINFIKLDVEGHELKALVGLGKYLDSKFIDFIQFEYGGANLDSHTSLLQLYDLLEDKGFCISKVMPKGLEIRKYQPYMENFSYANYAAISSEVIDG
ncbi:FkbM family methyltransferase [Marinobacterium sedimentorum]|uniref:FkbM family methyltransferase n=1 Tax=Marinobacterium sedimentorum TaxID=2927804 RepID=UPI0020C62493|nr:FkbM family methyltransferase [Marinobacterium sedimentorum]MCP8689371.1 FkbM family methyltransferase [Marinobacterium sedimentorum]